VATARGKINICGRFDSHFPLNSATIHMIERKKGCGFLDVQIQLTIILAVSMVGSHDHRPMSSNHCP
jgi:hypothetical protein